MPSENGTSEPPDDPEYRVRNDGGTLTPIFCTAEMPREVVTALLTKGQETPVGEDDSAKSYVVLTMTSTRKIMDIETYTADVDSIMSPQDRAFKSPFLGWSTHEVYDFVKSHIREPDKENKDWPCRGWAYYTFVILDEQSARDSTALLCSDAPDLGERGEEIVLKAARVPFADLGTMLETLETLVGTLSEHAGKFGKVLSLAVPACYENTEEAQRTGIYKIAREEVARRQKRSALLEAEGQGMLGDEKLEFAKSIRVA